MKYGLNIVWFAYNMVSSQLQVLTEAVRVSQQVYAHFIYPLLVLFTLYGIF